MEKSWRYCLKWILLVCTMSACDQLSNETYHHLDSNERRKLSADTILNWQRDLNVEVLKTCVF